jgi:hypothetical protein
LAEQVAVVPPLSPAQVHVHGPLPETALGVPALHRFVGVVASDWPLSLPQTPFVGGAVTVNTAVPVLGL